MGAHEWIDFHGLPALQLAAPEGARAIVMAHGAHLVSWRPAGGAEQLYLSERSLFAPGKAIRGGVPVIFPQFGSEGPYARHGFARTRAWTLLDHHGGADFDSCTFQLDDTPETHRLWPFPFHCELTVSIGGNRLDLELEVENPGQQPVRITCALHTYIAVAEVEAVRLNGLHGARYRDQVTRAADCADSADSLIVGAEVDRIYLDAPATLTLLEPGRTLGIHAEGFPDAVVWNPWEIKCAQLDDMPPLGFRRMLCVEAAAIGRPVRLDPGEAWWGRQSLIAL